MWDGAVEIRAPRAPIVNNVKTTPNRDAQRVKPLLLEQVTAPVRWLEVTKHIAGDARPRLGAGQGLAGLLRRIDRALRS